MESKDKHNTHIVALGAATIAVSFLVSSGHWDIFDLLISGVMLATTIYYARANSDLILGPGLYVIWSSVTIISTAFIISLVAVFAGITGCEFAATVDMHNAKLLLKNLDKNINYFHLQSIWHISIFGIASVFWWGIITFWKRLVIKKTTQKPDKEIELNSKSV